MPHVQRSALTDHAAEVRMADHTTLRVGGPVAHFVEAHDDEQLVEVVAECDRVGEQLLVLGGGSNLLMADDGFPGTVVHVRTNGIEVTPEGDDAVSVRVSAGVSWDGFVAEAVAQGWIGVEMLSGIPGLVGATPIQNVGAYGSDVSATIHAVEVWDRARRQMGMVAPGDCAFGYRMSLFKREPGRWLVVAVHFRFPTGNLGVPIAYPELARTLGVEVGGRAPMVSIRDAVLSIRRGKGMVLDQEDHDTWSAGSFFTNPMLSPELAERLPENAPRWPADGLVKTSAAWLIQAAGFHKGHGDAVASLSTKHVLAITNRGRATAHDLVDLAREVRDGVWRRFGIELVPEVNLVGTELGPVRESGPRVGA